MLTAFKSKWLIATAAIITAVLLLSNTCNKKPKELSNSLASNNSDSLWIAPSLYIDQITKSEERAMVIYGEDLIANTAKYLGPHGIIAHTSNGMNCQNCHLDAGKRVWGNNYGAVYSTYPKYRERSGTTESIFKRINNCFERSLNGSALDTNSIEVRAMYAYMKWLGQDVPKGEVPHGAGLGKLAYLDRAADPIKGEQVYVNKCQSCHGAKGEGQLNFDSASFVIPPLWGAKSYNDGAGLYRLSGFAFFVKSNMPFNLATHQSPVLTDEEAWDVAAFVNAKPRPHKDQSADWPDVVNKPVDFPFGPYADPFTEQQHKYGPFNPIEQWRKVMPKELAKKD
jgi:thiosulfate dehydrogenase